MILRSLGLQPTVMCPVSAGSCWLSVLRADVRPRLWGLVWLRAGLFVTKFVTRISPSLAATDLGIVGRVIKGLSPMAVKRQSVF